jgi:hypoxanthine phosphoribosyltransferase
MATSGGLFMNQIINLVLAVIFAMSVGHYSKAQIRDFKKEVISEVDRGLPSLTIFTQKLKK